MWPLGAILTKIVLNGVDGKKKRDAFKRISIWTRLQSYTWLKPTCRPMRLALKTIL